MQFFTRELYQAMQRSASEGSEEEESGRGVTQYERLWNAVTDEYARHLAAIKPSLPLSMREVASVSLHDGKVTSAQIRPQRVVALEVAGTGFWGPRVEQYADVFDSTRAILKNTDAHCIALPRIGSSRVTLTFEDVEAAEGLGDVLDDWWLYNEVHLSDGGGFDYRVLLQDSELRIVAKEVTFVDHGCG